MLTSSKKNPTQEALPLDTILEAEAEDSNYIIKDNNFNRVGVSEF